MGLTSWRKGPKGKVIPSDVFTAKNYVSDFDREVIMPLDKNKDYEKVNIE